MVVLWSLDFGEIEAVLAYALAAPILILFYFKVVGWFDSPSFSFLRGKGHTEIISFKSSLRHLRIVWRPITLAPHFKLRLYVEAAVIVIVSTDILSIIIFPPAYAHGWLYALFEYRQTPNGAHGSSYVAVLALVIIASIKWDDALKGIIYGGLMVFVHEGLWFPFYYLTNWGTLNIPLDAAFILWLLSMFFIARRKYHIVISKKSLVPYLALLLGWFAMGFPVTVKNISKVYFETKWYGDIWVEGIEVVSWLLIFGIFLWNLRLNEPHGWKWFEGIKLSKSQKRISVGMSGRVRRLDGGRSSSSHLALVHIGLASAIILFLLVATVPSIPVEAYANTFDNGGTCFNITSGTTCVLAIGADPHDCFNVCPAPIGSMVLVATWTDVSNSLLTISGAPLTQIYTSTVNSGGATNGFILQIFEEITTAQTNQTITITSGAYGWGLGFYIFDTGFNTLTGQGNVIAPCFSSCTPPLVITGFPNRNNALELSLWSGAIGSSFSLVECGSANCIGYGTSAQNPGHPNTAYTTNGGTVSCPTYGQCGGLAYYAFNIGGSYPSSISTATLVTDDVYSQSFVVLLFTNPLPPPVLLIVPPSIFSLNYWLFPILFLGLYDGFFLGEGLVAKVSTKGLTYLLIGGFVIGSFLAIIMGMIDYELPIISLIGFFIYIFRIKS